MTEHEGQITRQEKTRKYYREYRKNHCEDLKAYYREYRKHNAERYGPNEALIEYRKTLDPVTGIARAMLAKELGYAPSTITNYELGYLRTPEYVNEYVRKKMAEQNR